MLSAVVEPAARTLLLSRRGSCFAVLHEPLARQQQSTSRWLNNTAKHEPLAQQYSKARAAGSTI